jgi:hypothetical protein
MSLPFLNNHKITQALIGKQKRSGELEVKVEDPGLGEEQSAVAAEIIEAVKAGDASMLWSALQAAVQLLDEDGDETGEEL